MGKVFRSGNSLAIRIPAELGFKAGDEVVIKRIAGADVLVKKNLTWNEFNTILDGALETADVSAGHKHSNLPEKRKRRRTKKATVRRGA